MLLSPSSLYAFKAHCRRSLSCKIYPALMALLNFCITYSEIFNNFSFLVLPTSNWLAHLLNWRSEDKNLNLCWTLPSLRLFPLLFQNSTSPFIFQINVYVTLWTNSEIWFFRPVQIFIVLINCCYFTVLKRLRRIQRHCFPHFYFRELKYAIL